MILSALVVKTNRRSCEVYVIAQAEGRNGQRRFTNDALFTLALDDDRREEGKIVSTIVMPHGSALATFADASIVRRKERLELKTLLTRIYG
jgi:acyl-CoA hydrolase